MMFNSPFFQKFPQAPSTFMDDDGNEKTYQFPTFYAGSRGMMGMFTCSLGQAIAELPGKMMIPVPTGMGRAAVVVAAFEYNNPQGMDAYNEILYGIPVIYLAKGKCVPALGLVMKSLIVDQPDNIQRGKHLWGMNKSLGEINFLDSGDMRVCEVTRNGRLAIRMEVPKKGNSRKFEDCRTIISVKDGNMLRTRSCSCGRKVVSKGGSLEFGQDPFSVELESLQIGDSAFNTSFMPNFEQTLALAAERESL
jgi:Acetoacetate decarboxylase (ADC)